MGNVIEEAKSGRASCRTCKKPISKGELRFGEEAPNAFGDTPSMRWHHLACAADKMPAELKAALDAYAGEVPDRAELDKRMADSIAKGHAKPGGLPYADKAPTGRARCLQCQQPIEKDTLRVAVAREIETGVTVTQGQGYLHPGCVDAWIESQPMSKDDLVAGVRANSRLAAADLDAALAQIG